MLDFSVELQKTNELLERIATALERIAGPAFIAEPEPYVPRRTEPQDITVVNTKPESVHMKQLRELEKRLGTVR